MINTVNGQIGLSDLGITLMHEHITYADWAMRENFKSRYCQRDMIVEAAVKLFNKLKKYGVSTIVDGTVPNIGRDVSIDKEVADRTGLNFIVSSGFYYQKELYLQYRSEEQIYKLLKNEVENGIGDTSIKPGIMKVASENEGLTDYLKKLHKAIGRVAAENDIPIFCHHDPSTKSGIDVINVLEEVGVKPNKIIIGHAGDTNDIDYLTSLLDRGVYIGMDRFGYCDVSNNLKNRVNTIAQLIKMGYKKQMILSHDLSVFMGLYDNWNESFVENELFNPKVDYTFIFKEAIPKLEELGVTTEEIQTMLKENPIKIFE
nr:phosphotriesterase [uncultured Ligilactobacillus sp.]